MLERMKDPTASAITKKKEQNNLIRFKKLSEPRVQARQILSEESSNKKNYVIAKAVFQMVAQDIEETEKEEDFP